MIFRVINYIQIIESHFHVYQDVKDNENQGSFSWKQRTGAGKSMVINYNIIILITEPNSA